MRPLSSIVNRNSEKLSFLAISSLKASQDADTLALPIPSCAAMCAAPCTYLRPWPRRSPRAATPASGRAQGSDAPRTVSITLPVGVAMSRSSDRTQGSPPCLKYPELREDVAVTLRWYRAPPWGRPLPPIEAQNDRSSVHVSRLPRFSLASHPSGPVGEPVGSFIERIAVVLVRHRLRDGAAWPLRGLSCRLTLTIAPALTVLMELPTGMPTFPSSGRFFKSEGARCRR